MPDNIQIKTENRPIICLVGRVNVGKSKLFNRLIEQEQAIVSDKPGTTRTSNEGVIIWKGKEIKIMDTGGLTFLDTVPFEDDIIKQTEYAINHASLVIFVVDGKTGVLPQERELAKRIRNKKIPVMLAGNKIDSNKDERSMYTGEWAALGFGDPFPISASNGRNIGDFLDKIYTTLNKQGKRPKSPKDQKKELIKISIIGKPNAGKSSLFNKLIGQERVIVSEIAHTTREPHDTTVEYEYNVGSKTEKQEIKFIDTAGIRRKAKVSGLLERSGIQKSINTVDESDIILFVIDGSETISSQDQQLGGLIQKRGKSVIILVNKWDLAEDNSQSSRSEVQKMVLREFPHLDFAPIIFVSGLTGYKVHSIFPTIMQAWRARHTHVANRALENFLKNVTAEHRPSRGKGTRHPKLLGLRQIDTAPPVLELFVKYRTSLHSSYVNFLKNRLREQFDFIGTPIIMKLHKLKK